MKIVFCKIAWMEQYKGNERGSDQPYLDGRPMPKKAEPDEAFNFCMANMDFPDKKLKNGAYCIGYADLSEEGDKIALERISGNEADKKKEFLEDVVVVYCAVDPQGDKSHLSVVGWYLHATVYREYEAADFGDATDGYQQPYHTISKKKNCVLLPVAERRKAKWQVPVMGKADAEYGFGDGNIWYADEKSKSVHGFVKEINDKVFGYSGTNRIDG